MDASGKYSCLHEGDKLNYETLHGYRIPTGKIVYWVNKLNSLYTDHYSKKMHLQKALVCTNSELAIHDIGVSLQVKCTKLGT